MTAAELYDASPVSRHHRATRAEMEERGRFLIAYAARHGPVTVRQLYYRAVVEGIAGIDKTEAGYTRVQRQVLALRRAKRLRYEHIADATRWMRKPDTFDSVQEALSETARLYRKSLWREADEYVEVWCEKDALAGVVNPVTQAYDVPLMVTRGFSSETFCFEAVEAREGDDRPYVVYYLGDCDRAGRDAATSLKEKLKRFAAEKAINVQFVHLAIEEHGVNRFYETNNQALVYLHGVDWRWLPTREPKRNSPADRNWPHPFAIELDAIEPDDLRAMVQAAIEHHLPADQFRVLKAAEESERELIAGLVGKIAGDGAA
jgi:hypothetical protein